MNKKTFRHEVKHYINHFEYEILKNRLKVILKKDNFANENGVYHIRSLYFDDINNTALFEKQSGVLKRKKYRIRIYNFNDNVIKLEKKSRVAQFVHKESTPLTKQEYDMIINKKNEFLKLSNNKLFNEFYHDIICSLLRPKLIVDYVREAFVWGTNNVRITFDKNLKTGLYETNIFNNKIPTIDVIEEPKMILEIKYDNFLPDFIRSILQLNSNEKYAISKYTISRKFTKINNWEDN